MLSDDGLSYPLELGFTALLDQEFLLHEVETQTIACPEAFRVWAWNRGSKKIVLKMWEEYSRDLPHEHFQAQRQFLQILSDVFKTPMPSHMGNRKIVEALHNELYRLKNECAPASFMEIDQHVAKLAFMIQNTRKGTNEYFQVSAIERVRARMEQVVREDHARHFRRFFYGDPAPGSEDIEPIASTLRTEDFERAASLLWRRNIEEQIDSRTNDVEHLQRRHPSWKLKQVDEALKDLGHEPSLDHEESKIMPRKSKGVAGYIMLNDKLKKMLDQWCDLNTWKPDV